MLISVTAKDSKTVGQWAIPDNKGKTTIVKNQDINEVSYVSKIYSPKTN